jgi:voltage-gated potassium channel
VARQGPKVSNFDLFVLALSVLSVTNVLWLILPVSDAVRATVTIIDVAISVVFLTDFLMLLRRAPSKSDYFFKSWGWLDLLSSVPIPALKVVRIFRIARVSRTVHEMGLRSAWQRIRTDLAGSALLFGVFLVIIVLQYGSMLMLWAESDATDANIKTGSDALWWAFVSVTTVGYGDRFPVTSEGRFIGATVMSVGVGLFGIITGFLANSFLSPKRGNRAESTHTTDDLAAKIDDLVDSVASLSERLDRLASK